MCFFVAFPLVFLCSTWAVPFGALFFFGGVSLLFRFLSVSFRCFRRLLSAFSSLLSLFPLAGLFCSAAVFLVLSPWWVVCLVLRALFFARFSRPAPLWWLGSGSRCWVCVPLASLPALCSARAVFAVRPAVVRRRLGVVLWVWVWAGVARPSHTHTTN